MSATATAGPTSSREPVGDWVEVHPRASRWMHWINFPLLAVMIYSGLRIYWANDVYALGVGPVTLFQFFPAWFYERFDLAQSLARGLAFHFTFAWLFTLNGLAYVTWLAYSGEWRHLVPDRASWREAGLVVLHDLGLRKQAPPQGRYNAAQRVMYTIVVAMGALMVLTGLAILKSTQLSVLTRLFGGYQNARFLHFATTIGFVVFFGIHLVQVARAGMGNFLGMVTGFARSRRMDNQRSRRPSQPEEVDA